jgi:GxxExxY protein
MEIGPEHNRISGMIVDAAMSVHRALGPGLLESVYEQCLATELGARDIHVTRQLTPPIVYRDIRIEGGLRLDMLVSDAVVVEVKAVERILPVHEAQLLTYLKLSGYPLGLLINFNVPLLKAGVKRFVLSPRNSARSASLRFKATSTA